MTLLELVIAMSVFAIIAGGVASVGWSGLKLSSSNRDRSTAANLAGEDLDEVQQMDFDDLAAQINTSIPAETITVGEKDFTVQRSVSWAARAGGTTICDYGADVDPNAVVQVITTVTWPDKPSTMPPAEATTIISPPVGSGPDATDGAIPVTVLDAGGDPQPGVHVSATDGGTHTYTSTTDANGCGFLLVEPETYTVSLSDASYVARDGATDPQTVVTVSPGGNVAVAFDYDRAGSIDLTTVNPANMSDATVPANIPVTLSYQFFTPTGQRTYASTGFPSMLGGLFPDSYGLWAGDCDDADPHGTYWSGGQGSAPAVVPAGGGAVAAELFLGAVDVDVTEAGLPLVGASVRAVHDGTSGGTCPAGSPSVTGYDLGVTDAIGQVRGALPFGHWEITVTGPSGSSTQSVAVDPAVSDPGFFLDFVL